MDLERAAKQASEVSAQAAQLGGFRDAGCDTVMAPREKRFGECGLEEKIERLRNVLQATDQRTDAALRIAQEAHELAHEHSHDPMGRVLRLARETLNRLRGAADRNRRPLD